MVRRIPGDVLVDDGVYMTKDCRRFLYGPACTCESTLANAMIRGRATEDVRSWLVKPN